MPAPSMRAVGDVHAPERRRMPAEAPPAGRQGFSTACDSGHNAENPLRIYGCPQTTSTQSTVEESHLRLCEMFRLRFAPPRYSPVIGGGRTMLNMTGGLSSCILIHLPFIPTIGFPCHSDDRREEESPKAYTNNRFMPTARFFLHICCICMSL